MNMPFFEKSKIDLDYATIKMNKISKYFRIREREKLLKLAFFVLGITWNITM